MVMYYPGRFPITNHERFKHFFQWKAIAPDICSQIPLLLNNDELPKRTSRQLTAIHRQFVRLINLHNEEEMSEIEERMIRNNTHPNQK